MSSGQDVLEGRDDATASGQGGSRPVRPVGVRMTLPGTVEETAEGSVSSGVACAVRDVFRSELRVRQVEFLSFPAAGTGEQVYLLSGSVSSLPEPPERVESAGQVTLHDSISGREEPADGSLGHLANVLERKLRENLPASVDLETVQVDFSSLGVSSVRTSRFATGMNRRVSPGEFVPGTFEQLLAELRDVPHVYQVLIANRSQTQFEVSVRIAECDVQSQLATREQLATAIRSDQLRSPGSAFEALGLRSSLDIGASELQAGGNTLFLGDSTLDKAAVIELARGYREFEDLLRGRMGFDPVYEELGWYPKFVIDNRDLTNFLGLPPISHASSPWDAAPGREPPALHSVDPATADDTPQHPTAASSPQHATGETASQKEGGMTHQWWVERTATVLRERGYDVEIVDQTDGGSVPDLWCRTPDGDIAAVEVESKNASKPASLLTNLVRADRWDVDVIVVGTSKAKAKDAANKLSKPFKRATPDHTLLYNATTPVSDGDHTQLLPDGVTTANWWLTPDDELQLELDADVVATGPATDPTATFDYPTPRYHVDNNTHVVTDSDDTVLHRYDSKSALLEDWTLLRAPLVPTRLTYLDMVTFKYGSDGALEPFTPSATWDIEPHMDRYEGALTEYFETYTVEQEGADLRRDDVRDHALTWYRQQTQYKEPNRSMFGRCSPDTLQTKANSKPTGKIHYYDNRTWRYSPGLTSPDLPTIDHEPNYPDHWATPNDE